VQINGENFLIPVDFKATSPGKVKDHAYSATLLAKKLGSAGADSVILVFDACRNNPYENPAPAAGTTRSLADSPGLAEMKPDEYVPWSALRASAGMLIQFTTMGGGVVGEPPDDNSLFVRHFVEAVGVAGLTVEQVFARVRVRVAAESKGTQVPLTTSSLTRAVYFLPPRPVVMPIAPSEAELLRQSDEASWKSLSACGKTCLAAYLEANPRGHYVETAKAALASLAEDERREKAQLLTVMDDYVKAFTKSDLRALKRLYPRMPDEQQDAIRQQKKVCNALEVRVDQPPVILTREADSAMINTVLTYDCARSTRQGPIKEQVNQVFKLRKAQTAWLIDNIAPFGK
jgi:hypothetical protein